MALTLEVTVRDWKGKGAARKARRAGMVPGVIYGKGVENLAVLVDGPQLQRLMLSEGAGGLIDLKVDGKSQVVLIKGVQSDPVMGRNVHVDFHAVSLDQEVMVTVPIALAGEDIRTNDGGVVTQSLRELSVYCLPTAIPDRIDVDVSSLSIGDTVTVGAISLPEGVRSAQDDEETVVSIVAPAGAPEETTKSEEAEEGGEAAGAAEGDTGDSAAAE